MNGVRLMYRMEKEAMRFWNLPGSKFFSLAFSWLLGQSWLLLRMLGFAARRLEFV